MSRASKTWLGAGLIASTVLASCSPNQPTTWTATLTRPDGVALNVTVEDPPGVVAGLAVGRPDLNFHHPTRNSLGVLNPGGDPTRLLVTWMGGVCTRTDANVTLARSDLGLSISVREPRTLQGCTDAVAEIKAIELRLRTPVDAHRVAGTLLDP